MKVRKDLEYLWHRHPRCRFSGAAPVKVRKAVAQAAEINANLRASVGPHP